MKLWLDDIRDPVKFTTDPENWTWVKTAAAAISALRTGGYEYASLDHDLTHEQMVLGGYQGEIYDDGVKSGYDVVCWLEQNPEYWPKRGCKVHSQNISGAARMRQVIERYYR